MGTNQSFQTVQREALLEALNDARVGLARRITIEQSETFVFTEGNLYTFNEEICYRGKSPLNITAVVPAAEIMRVLNKLTEDEIRVGMIRDEFRVKGKSGRAAGFTSTTKIALPFDTVPLPKRWRELEPRVWALLKQAAATCGTDISQVWSTVVHATPDIIEACDNRKFFRGTRQTGFHKDVRIPAASLLTIKHLVPAKFCVDKGWLHFLLESQAIVSVRLAQDKYIEGMDDLLSTRDMVKTKLPANLGDIIGRAETMTSSGYGEHVHVHLEKGALTLSSRSPSGWYSEKKRIRYDGPKMEFDVRPSLLRDVLKYARGVMIGDSRMSVKGDDYIFVVYLHEPEEEETE